MIQNVLVAAVSQETDPARARHRQESASSNLCTRASEAYYMARNYATLETNRCLQPNAGSTQCCLPMG